RLDPSFVVLTKVGVYDGLSQGERLGGHIYANVVYTFCTSS
ncbi:MAG: hypothetical protein ACD_64C00178G0003, partial [uncultured bacterium]